MIFQKYMKLPSFLLLAVLLTFVHSRFSVYMPTCAINQIPNEIKYTLSNFGHILYGRSIVGELYAYQNQKFCEVDNVPSVPLSESEVKPFILIKRGDCKFTKKILNAQLKGAKLAIIYDNDSSTSPDVIMANDGHGHLIDIPSIFVSNADGVKLNKTLQECTSVILKIEFQVSTSKVANVTLWLNSNNRQSYIMLRDFYRDYYPVIKSKMKLDVKFKVNSHCGHENCEEKDCVSEKKKYCLATQRQINSQKLPGKQIINEHLRSYFLFEQTKSNKNDIWWKYMNKFDDNDCIEKLDMKSCSEKTMTNQKYDYKKVNAKVEETYTNLTMGRQNVLEKFVDQAYKHDIVFYPEATINGKNFYGLFRAPDIFQMICESLESPPTECKTFLKNDRKTTFGKDQSKGVWKLVLLILAFMAIAFLVALFAYTRLIKKEVNQQMSVQVNKMVEHYVQLSEEKSRSSVQM